MANGISITRNITIDGDGKVIINANNLARVFDISSGATVTLRGIIFINGNASGSNGGSIYSEGIITITDCIFINYTAVGHGGAIYLIHTSKSTIENCEFPDNFAGLNGGAIDWHEGAHDGNVYNSTFTNNIAMSHGGAIFWSGHNSTVEYSKFYVSNGHGGYKWLLYVESNDTNPSPTCWAIDEYYDGDGGSILWGGGNGLIDNYIFIDSNFARSGGGAYMLGSDHVTFSNSYFENCTSRTNDGGLDWLAGAIYGMLINSTFNNIRAVRSSGAIYYDGDLGEMINSTVINATAFGGALDSSSNGKMKYAGWDSSHGDTNTMGGDAGAIMFTGDNIYVYNSTFINCTAVGRGGAVFLQDNDNVTFEFCTFEENSALGIANNTWKNYKKYRSDNNHVTFTVYKDDSVIKLEVQNITYSDVEHTIIQVNAEGNGNIEVNGAEETIVLKTDDSSYEILRADPNEDYSGKDHVCIYNLKSGEYPVEVTFNGNDDFTTSIASSVFYVGKANLTFNVEVEDIMEGDVAVINITLPQNATGNVTVIINNIKQTAELNKGSACVRFDNLASGNKTVVVEYSGDQNYTSNYTLANFTVKKAMFVPDLSVIDLGNGTVAVVVGYNASGEVTISVDGQNFAADVINGVAYVNIDDVAPGVHDGTVTYSGDVTHNSTSTTSSIDVPKYDKLIIVDIGEIAEGGSGFVTVTVPDNATGNVTVYVGGKNVAVEVHDGVVSVEIGNLTAGNHTVVVRYSGDDNYVPKEVISNITVEKAIVVPDLSVIDLGNGTVAVVVGDNASGNVTISVDGKNFTADVVNGTAYVNVDDVAPGVHDVEVIYSGDVTHNSTSTTSSIDVPKYDKLIIVDIGEIAEGGSGFVTVTVPDNATGNVTVYVGGKNVAVEVHDGVASVEIGNLTAGNHTVVVRYSGDDNYVSKEIISNITVEKAIVVPDLSVIDLGNGTVAVVVGDNASGNVTITIDGRDFTAEVINGTAYVTLGDDLTPGVHDAQIVYSGDDMQNSTSTTSSIEVPKHDSTITIGIGNITEGENGIITVNVPDGATGNVTVYVDGKEFTAPVKDGVATVEVGNLTAGDKTIVVEYSGDDNYVPEQVISNITVEKAKSTPDLAVVDLGNGTVAVVVGDNVSGNVTITIDGRDFTAEVINGTAYVTLGDDLIPGVHDAQIVYSGDDMHNSTSTSSSIDVPKHDSPISIDTGNITEGEGGIITVNAPNNASGNITVYVDGKEFTAPVKDGVATVEVGNLTAGDKTIVVEYSGDDNYAPEQVISNLTVEKAKSTPDLVVVDKGNGTVVVVVGDNATGNVTVTVGGENYTAEVINGVAVVNRDNLTPGTHNIQIAYSDDVSHAPSNASSSVNVHKVECPISVSVEDIYVGDTAVIEVKIADDATGNVTIEIDGIKYSSQINEGKAVFEVPDLAKGTKTIAVDYAGDDNCLANHRTGTITVSKRPSFVNATITDIDVGENVTITVTVSEDATGQVLIDIDGVGYYVNVTNGIGVAQIPRMPNGIYDVNLTYTGDDKYESSSSKGSFNVSKVESFVIPVAQNITVGDLEVITLTVPQDATGIVTVIIDGVEYHLDEGKLLAPEESGDIYSVAISGGNGILVISGLPKGEYVVSAKYNGDLKYLPCTNTTIFMVSDKNPSIKIIDQNNGTVVVVLPEDATGNVMVTVDGKTFPVDVVNGTAVVNVDGLEPGEHEMTIIYSGDDYYGKKTQTGTVNVPKIPAPISVSVDDVGVGQTAVVTITLPDDATGTVTIEINAKKYTAEIVNGKAVFNVDGLAVGNKTVAVTYTGNNKYLSNFTTGQFEMSKIPSNVKATSEDIKVGDDATIKATFPQDATDRALLRLANEEYYADIVNGEAIFKIPNLVSGEYEALLGYAGDENYEPSNTTTRFIVSKYSEPVSASGDSIQIGENVTVVVNLPIDATGIVTITVDGKTYTKEVADGQAVFSIPGLQSGVHSVTVYYSGDAKYEANVTTTVIVVADSGNNTNITPENRSDVPEKAGEGINLSKYRTGNPIFVLLLILFIGGVTRFRKSEE